MGVTLLAAITLLWMRARRSKATTPPEPVQDEHMLTRTTQRHENVETVQLQITQTLVQGDIMWHLRQQQTDTSPTRSPRAPTQHTEPVRSRRFERPSATRTERVQFLTQDGRDNLVVTFLLAVEWLTHGYSRIAYEDRAHFITVPLTAEEIRMSDLHDSSLAPGETWVRLLVGNTWVNPVILGGEHGFQVTALKMHDMLIRGWQFWWEDRFSENIQEGTEFTGRLPEGQEVWCVFRNRLWIQIKWPLQWISSTGAYACNPESPLEQQARAAPTVDWRWNRDNPLPSSARSRVHDTGGLMLDLDTMLEEHELADLSLPRWLKAALLGMQSARDLQHWFEQGTPGYTTNNALYNTMATFTDASILPSEAESVGAPGRGVTVARATWDASSRTPVIGYTLMLLFCPAPNVYSRFFEKPDLNYGHLKKNNWPENPHIFP